MDIYLSHVMQQSQPLSFIHCKFDSICFRKIGGKYEDSFHNYSRRWAHFRIRVPCSPWDDVQHLWCNPKWIFHRINRMFGSALLGFVVLLWYGRSSDNQQLHRAVLTSMFTYWVVSSILLLLAQLAGLFNAMGWGVVILHLVFTIAYGYSIFKKWAMLPLKVRVWNQAGPWAFPVCKAEWFVTKFIAEQM